MKRSKTQMLQMLRNLAVAMLLGAGLASCSQDDNLTVNQGEPLPPGEYPLILTAGGLEAVATPTQKSAPFTRGTVDNDWRGVTSVAVEVDNEVKEYKVTPLDGESKIAKLEVKDGGEPFYWQSTAETKTITAWHPYSNTYPTQWTVKADQSTADNYQASDLIKGMKRLTFLNKDNAAENKITFAHQTAKIVVNIEAGVGGVVLDGKTKVQLLNVEGVENVNNQSNTTITTYRPDANKQTFLALLSPQTIGTTSPFIQVNTGGNTYCWTPTEDKELNPGMVYTYTITVSNTGLTVKVDDGIAWGDDGTVGSGSVDLDIVLDDKHRKIQLSDGDEITVKGNGSQSKGQLTFDVPSGSTATVNLENINIGASAVDAYNSSAEQVQADLKRPLYNFIRITGGGEVIFRLIGTNTIKLADSKTDNFRTGSAGAIWADRTDITITGSGKLIITGDGDVAISAINGGNITIRETTINMDYIGYYGAQASCIGAYGGHECGDIVIDKCDITISFTNDKFTLDKNAYATAIGPGNFGKCGDLTITLQDGQDKSAFLGKITIKDKNGNTVSDDQKVMYSPSVYSQYGTLTWLDSAGKPITE